MTQSNPESHQGRLTRRSLLGSAAAVAAAPAVSLATNSVSVQEKIITPPEGKRLLLSCKLTMIAKKAKEKTLSLAERLTMAAEAGFDGVDLDDASPYTPQEARDAVQKSGVFVHNAINHAHWSQRLTSAKPEEREKGRNNIAHCIRVSHAAGGNGVLIVLGRASDGSTEETEDRCREEMKKLLPLAASLGQMILIENVWNGMMYEHDKPPEQSAERFVKFVDSFKSPWVGMYYDIGNHWKYGQPRQWINEFQHRCVKLDVKGFSREAGKFTDIGEGDLPWGEVRKGLDEVGFTGWATAETGGGGLKRLTKVRKQMEKVFQL